jgi:DNA repair exonuclease SbcCD nuclease subunit
MYKFLHTADVHLDSPLLNLDRYDGAPIDTFRGATRRALDNIVELAIAEQARFVIIAGDLYDGDCRDFNTPLHFRRRMEDLHSQGIRVFIIQGNHDAESKMRKAFQLALPDNVVVYPTKKPTTEFLDDPPVAIHGQGFPQRDVTADLSENYPQRARDRLNIGILHTSCGLYEGHDCYAPSTITGLASREYDYWALGHIHKREILKHHDPWIVYPGNPQGRNIREPGARACAIVTVDHDRVTEVAWREVDVVRWHLCAVDATELPDADGVMAEAEANIERQIAISAGRPLAVRIEITGATPTHREFARHATHWDRRLREQILNRFDDRIWIEKIKFQTRTNSTAMDWDRRSDPLGILLEAIVDAEATRAIFEEVRGDYEQLRKQLPTDPRLLEPAISLDDDWWADRKLQTELLSEVKDMLLSRLLDTGDPG